MAPLTEYCPIVVNSALRHQRIDGFGVNINGRCWANGLLAPVVDLLVDDLGATLYRLDVYGKSNWPDPDGSLGCERALSRENLDRVYASPLLQNGLGMARHLNSRGVEPYVTLSGVVPPWMCAADGKTLADVDAYCRMATDFALWLRKSGITFTLFGPQNETDLGPPEGPLVDPQAFVKLTLSLAEHFDRAGLSDVKFVVAEEGGCKHHFVETFNNCPALRGRVAAFGMHCYCDDLPVADVVARVEAGPHQNASVWMSEYGDLDQTGEQEFYFAWRILQRLFHLLTSGMNAALNWDAFDNYHDHDEHWTIYGLIRTGLRTHTPRKRYYACKQVYRFVRPGAVRVDASTPRSGVHVLAFLGAAGEITVCGMNGRSDSLRLAVTFPDADKALYQRPARGFVTTDALNCAEVGARPHRPWSGESLGFEMDVPARSVFTITTIGG
jgi:O-glycosyl hydrolase